MQNPFFFFFLRIFGLAVVLVDFFCSDGFGLVFGFLRLCDVLSAGVLSGEW